MACACSCVGYTTTEEWGEIAALVAGATASPLWVPVSGRATAFDIALFRRGANVSFDIATGGCDGWRTGPQLCSGERLRQGLWNRIPMRAGRWRAPLQGRSSIRLHVRACVHFSVLIF